MQVLAVITPITYHVFAAAYISAGGVRMRTKELCPLWKALLLHQQLSYMFVNWSSENVIRKKAFMIAGAFPNSRV